MRYVEGEPELGKFTLQEVSGCRPKQILIGFVGDQPQWLSDILAVAVVGGHCLPILRPPPVRILWFALDHDNNLLRFIDIAQ